MDGWMVDGGWMDGWWTGDLEVEKNMFFGNISKTTQYFFLVVSRPLRRLFKTFSVKNSKNSKFFIFCKKFRTIFFQRFFRFFEVCSSGDLVNFLEVCSSGVLYGIPILMDCFCI